MVKVIIRETIISLLVCLAVLLVLSLVFYNYIPSNKVIPETVEYKPSKEIQTQLNTAVNDDSKEIIMTYEITSQDLDNYERINEYNPGKANPFAPVSETVDGETENGETTNPQSGGGPAIVTPSGSNQSTGSLFENGTSK